MADAGTGSVQFLRKYSLEIDDTDGEKHIISGLRIAFDITQDLFGAPSNAKITIYNLSRAKIDKLKNACSEIRLSVGYGDSPMAYIHIGKVINVMHYRENENGITEFYSMDAMIGFMYKNISKSYAKDTPLGFVIKDIAEAMGLTVAKSTGAVELTKDAITFNCSCKQALNEISDSYDKWYTAVLGELFVVPRDKAAVAYTSDDVVVISRNSGMIGYPTITEIGAEVTCLLNPLVKPLSVIRIDGAIAPRISIYGDLFTRLNGTYRNTLGSGLFRVQKIQHQGDTHGDQWETNIVGRDFENGQIEPLSVPKGVFP